MLKRHHMVPFVLSMALWLAACGGDKGEAELLASARSLLATKDYKAAAIQLKNVLQKNSSLAEARFMLGSALLESGDAIGAEVELRRASELKHPAEAVAPLLAKSLLVQREHHKVVDQFAAVVLGDAEATASVLTSVALAHLALGSADKAREAAVKALRAAPAHVPAQLVLARIKAAAEDFNNALASLDELLARAPENTEALQFKGDLLVRARADTRGAIGAYRQVLAVRPNDPQAHASLIALYFVEHDEAAAQRQFEALKKALPNHPLTRYHEAQQAFARGDYPRARELLRGLLQLTPDNATMLHIAGATELKLNAAGQAEVLLNRAVQLQPEFVAARRLLARAYLQSNRPAKALLTLRPVVDKPQADAESLRLAGQALLLTDDAKAADAMFARAVSALPNDAKARAALALSQLSNGHADTAFNELQSIASSDQGTTADLALVSAHLKRAEFELALRAIDALERKQPASAVASDLRGRVHLMRKDAAAARASFEKALKLDPAYLPAAAYLASLDMLAQQPARAQARFDAVLKSDPNNVQALLALAELKRRSAGTSAEVAKLLGDAISANPTDADARLMLVEHHLASNDVKAGLAAARAGALALPDSAEVQESLARALMRSGDANQANSSFGKIVSMQPESPIGHQGLAELAIARRDFPAAARHAQRALELAPGSIAAQRASIVIALHQRRHPAAIAIAAAMQTQHPTDSLGFILEGDIEADRKHWDPAAAAFRKALGKRNPAQAPGRLHSVLTAAKKPAEAAKFADSWGREHPADALFQLYLADVATKQGDAAQAERHYQQVLKSQPDNAMALNNLASLLTRQGRPGAVALAERAVKAAPGNAALLDTLAMAQSIDNRHAAAIALQKQVVAQAPDVPAFRLTLAKIYARSGDRESARSELAALAKLDQAFVGREEVAPLRKSLEGS